MKVKGKEKFAKQIAAIPQSMRDEISKAVETSADEMADLARRFAPAETGRLRNSIGWTRGDVPKGAITAGSNDSAKEARAAKGEAGLAATIYAGGGEAFYARFQEFGTPEMSANPFFFPAWRLSRKRAKSRIQRAVRSGAKKAFSK